MPAPVNVYWELVAPPPRLSVEPAFTVMVAAALLAYVMAELMVAVLPAATVMAPFTAATAGGPTTAGDTARVSVPAVSL